MTRELKAYFFDTSIDPKSGQLDYPDATTPLGTYIAFCNAHDRGGSFFDTSKFYHPNEVEKIVESWNYLKAETKLHWPLSCEEAELPIRGFAEIDEIVYMISSTIHVLKKKGETWYRLEFVEHNFEVWLVRTALSDGTVERVNFCV